MSEVVTGDAVVVEVRVAQPPIRAVALAIDMIVQVILMVGVFLAVGFSSVVSDPALAGAVSILISVLVMAGYPVIFETATRGRSLGKLALGLRVVSDDGGPPSASGRRCSGGWRGSWSSGPSSARPRSSPP
ncbi:RDD family protein [Nonomuraea dietziae]|uniref:RDD family protein n=1 Tax=Nonomuraea dietziae TaxID=65515 RepID=UPI0031D5A864